MIDPPLSARTAAAAATAATELPPVQMLWFGRPLGDVERLSIMSFLRQGHPVHLFAYGDPGDVPRGAEVIDGAAVIPQREFDVLRARGVKPGVFSDYFRAMLLLQRGGWWVDCDVVCLRPFDFRSELVYGWQDPRVINGAVLRIPAGHRAAALLVELCRHPSRWQRHDSARRLAKKTRDAALGRRRIENVAWGATGPASVTAVVRALRLHHHAMATEVFYPVAWEDSAVLWRPGGLGLASATYAVHLWNEVRGGRQALAGSPVDAWMRQYGVAAREGAVVAGVTT
jgi:hypothetical protein